MRASRSVLCFSLICLLGLSGFGLARQSRRLDLTRRPEPGAPPAGLLAPGDPFEVVGSRGGWILVHQGEVLGWVLEKDLWKLHSGEAAAAGHSNFELQLVSPLDPGASPAPGSLPQAAPQPVADRLDDPGGIHRFLEFALGDSDRERMMSHPLYRDRIGESWDEWGPLYYRNTGYFYVKGIFLGRFDRFRLGLFKRRVNYQRFMGESWSDDFLDTLLLAEEGWRSSRRIFGRGREYYLQLSFHF